MIPNIVRKMIIDRSKEHRSKDTSEQNQVELTPRERRHQRTQHAIIEAARQIIRETGVESLSIRAIAERIDYSPAGLYEYFGSKEEIIAAVCTQNFERFAKRLAQVDKRLAPTEYMLELGLAYIDFAVHNPDSFLLMFTTFPLLQGGRSHALPPDGQGAKAGHDAFLILVQGVQRCVDAGIYHTTSSFGVVEMAYASWTQVHGMAMLRITNGGMLPLDYTVVEREALQRWGAGLSCS